MFYTTIFHCATLLIIIESGITRSAFCSLSLDNGNWWLVDVICYIFWWSLNKSYSFYGHIQMTFGCGRSQVVGEQYSWWFVVHHKYFLFVCCCFLKQEEQCEAEGLVHLLSGPATNAGVVSVNKLKVNVCSALSELIHNWFVAMWFAHVLHGCHLHLHIGDNINYSELYAIYNWVSHCQYYNYYN